MTAPADSDPVSNTRDAEQLLTHWRERVLQGVVWTALIALMPGFATQGWQAFHGAPDARSSLWLGCLGSVLLCALALWRGPLRVRAALLIGFGFLFGALALITDGFAPAQCVELCAVIMISALFYGVRVAAVLVLLNAGVMAFASYGFAHGMLVSNFAAYTDVRVPMNWLRVGLYSLFGSASAAAAGGYLLSKLRATLAAQTSLVASLRAEIAQRKQAGAELERAQAQLLQAQKLEAVGQLAAGIAHDFNNTLSVVTLEAELLKRQAASDTARRSADALLSAAIRGKQLTHQLLLFSRPRPIEKSGGSDATEALAECVDALRRLLPSEITFEVDIAPGPLPVGVQASELQQIVLNVGINARDAMLGPGSLKLRLLRQQLSAADASALRVAPGAYACFVCSDSGSGMTPDTLRRVFEPFFSTKPPGRGTGLGLTNVWNIAQRASGTVRAESTPGAGTTISVYLPLMAAMSAQLSEAAPLPAPQRAHETVLVVEDDIRLRALIVTVLAEAGYSVLDAANVDAALALEQAHHGPLHLLCTDVVMPGRPARDLISELRARHEQLAILICSGYSQDEQIVRGVRSGAFQYLDKPFTRTALLSAVRAALDPPPLPLETHA